MAECKVCAAPEVGEMVDDLLDKGVFLEVISNKLAALCPPVLVHKSSIHRHRVKHYLPRLRLRMAEQKAHGGARGRLAVEWAAEAFGELAGKVTICENEDSATPRIIAANELRENDVLITVDFEPARILTPPEKATPQETPR